MPTAPLRFRQVHLDFHTSPHIPDIGADFDPDQFADTLQRAHINSVTVFARCHHGLLYYPSKRHPERIHPRLKRLNLLGEQIEACHKRDIRAPIYTTVQWDDYTADEHRDWLHVDENGTLFGTPPLTPGFYRFCDVYHPGYRQFLFDHTQELLETLPVDGLFFDIVQPRWSLARHWIEGMDRAGFNPEDEDERMQFATKVINEWKLEMSSFIRRFNKDCTIFYNAGHIGPRHRATLAAYTHYELESLPSGGWGYLHFPLTQRYVRGMDPAGHGTLGMTGKFHTSWGDFHSFKNPVALQFECFHMLALGARCSVGDQLHPRGKMEPTTYELIGEVYREVAAREPWCEDAQPVHEIGVVTPEEFAGQKNTFYASAERQPIQALGVVRMLQELGVQFDMISTDRDLSPYRLIILPDRIPVFESFAKKLSRYVRAGGRVIASYQSGLTPAGDAFAFDGLGVTYKGPADFSPDFLVPGKPLLKGLATTGYAMYERGLKVSATRGAKVLARVQAPYFNRNWRHFCSHRHTPSSGQSAGYPGAVRHDVGKGACIYFAHPIFAQYHENAPRWCRQLLANAIDLLMPQRLVTTDGPSSLINSLMHQPGQRRYVLHLLHYVPERRGQAFDIIEDILPLHDRRVSIQPPTKANIRSVRIVPAGDDLPFEIERDRLAFTVPKLNGYAMVELAY